MYGSVRKANAGDRERKTLSRAVCEVHLLEPDTMSYSAGTEDSEKTSESRENCFFGCEQLSAV